MATKTELIQIRCEPEFKAIAKLRAARLGISLTDLFVEAVLAKDFVVVERNPKMLDFHSQISGIGRNLNQMVHAMNRINRESKSTHDINLYLNNPEFRQIAKDLDGLINNFQSFNQKFSESEKELCRVVSRRVLFDDADSILEDNPDLLKKFQSRLET